MTITDFLAAFRDLQNVKYLSPEDKGIMEKHFMPTQY